MPTPTKGARLGGSAAHQQHILANLATALFEHGKITTTEARARRLRPYAERLITVARRGDLHARRQVLSVLTDKSVVHRLFAEIGPSFENRDGGYTRITKVGPRKGDNAPLAVIELIAEEPDGRSRRRRSRRSAARTARTRPAPAEAVQAEPEFEAADEEAAGPEPEFEAADEEEAGPEPEFEAADEEEAGREPEFEAADEEEAGPEPEFEAADEEAAEVRDAE